MVARSLALAASLLFAAGAAQAQDIRPRILLVFDTSGSMGWDVVTGEPTGGDNSVEYPGDGRDSRLHVAKQVIRGIVETTSEVEFGLMRYPQVQGDDINDGTDREFFTGYTGLNANPLNYLGFCSGTLRPMEDQPFALVVPFEADNEPTILRWMDGRESFPADPELRAEGPTPIAESLRLVEESLRATAAQDPAAACRRYNVVLLTDGAESCVPGAQRQQALVDRTLALRELTVNGQRVQVKVFVVAFAVDPGERSLLDGVARIGGTAVDANGEPDAINGRAYEAADQAALQRAFSRILAEAIPSERCDGRDDDCDGRADEGATNACGACGPTPVEVCNGRDDDCDGRTDEGVRNRCGGCGAVPAETCNGVDDDCDGRADEEVVNACGGCAAVQEEVCNGLDDDCDGRVDNTPGDDAPLGRPCSQDLGACRAGVEACVGGRWQPCDGVLPTDEACNGADDDCDGVTDEITRPCGAAVENGEVGQCRVGRETCDDGAWSGGCDAVDPTAEVCDGLDNDCDGQADEQLFNACGTCGPAPTEACNGLDDNCDGRVDEGAECPAGYLCYAGDCVFPCDDSGECPGGFTCVDAWPGGSLCHPDPCAGARCPAGTVCDAATVGCLDPCRDVECPAGQACELGDCVAPTCRHTGCPDGQLCRADACVADPCAGVDCGTEGFCRDGACVPACRRLVCGAGRRCLDGACVDDPCDGKCLGGQRCAADEGVCYQDPCLGVACAAGTACVEGECRADAPCVGVRCPGGTVCVDGSCTDLTPGDPPPLRPGLPALDGGPGAGDGGPVMRDAGAGGPDTAAPPVTPDAAFAGTQPGGGCDCDGSGGAPVGWGWALVLIGIGRVRLRRRG
ncbi:MAG: hypothetical protein H6704_00070 [Myxococcales bacterium]|nr:hypothetical protein [Myxococcales bacterium]